MQGIFDSPNFDQSTKDTSLNRTPSLTDVIDIVANNKAFAALKKDGTVVCWGDRSYGANYEQVTLTQTSSNYTASSRTSISSQLTNVQYIYSTTEAFAALKKDGTVVAWGRAGITQSGTTTFSSGSTNASALDHSVVPATNALTNVVKIYSNSKAFVAKRSDGGLVTWGSSSEGGSMTCNPPPGSSSLSSIQVKNNLASGVVEVFNTNTAFAALKDDGSVVVWGGGSGGGYIIRSGSINIHPTTAGNLDSGVVNIFPTALFGNSNSGGFAALKDDGSVVTWGEGPIGTQELTRWNASSTTNVTVTGSTATSIRDGLSSGVKKYLQQQMLFVR